MPRRRHAAQEPALVLTTTVDFKAESIDGEREAWAALCAELGVDAVQPPASYTRSLRPNDPAAKPRLTARLPVATKAAEGKWEKEDGQTVDDAERALLAKLRDAFRQLLATDHRLHRRLRQQHIEEERRELRAAWRSKDLAGLQEKLAADPLWYRLFRPTTVRAQAADIARMGSRLAMSLEAGADPAAKPLFADSREKLAALGAKAQALLQPIIDRELQGFLASDAATIKELAALQLALLRNVGELAGLAGKPGTEAEADAVGELKASVAKLQAHMENGPPEPASALPSTASSLRDSSAPPSPTASRDASPSPKARRLTAASPVRATHAGILKPGKNSEGRKGTWFMGLDVDEAEHVRFATAAEHIKDLAARRGVLLQHLRYNVAAIEGAKVGLALTAFPDESREVAEVMDAIEDAVATPLAPTEAPEPRAVLDVLASLPGLYTKGRTQADRKAVAKALSAGYHPDETPVKIPAKVRWANDVNSEKVPGASGRPLVERDLMASPAAFLVSASHAIPPPTPAQPAAAQTLSIVAVAGRRGKAVVALLGVSPINGKVLIDFQSLRKDYLEGWTDDRKKALKLADTMDKNTERAVVLERQREDKYEEAVFQFRIRGLDAARMEEIGHGMAAEAHVGFVVADADHLPPADELDLNDITAVRLYLVDKIFQGAEWAEILWARIGYGGVLTDEAPGTKPSIEHLVEPSSWTGVDKEEDESFGTTYDSSAFSASSTAPSPRPGSPRRRSPAITPQATQPTTSPALNGTTPDSRADPSHSDATPTRLTF